MAHFASSLACAVLQYHSTPWLPEGWQSNHVRFFGVTEHLLETADFIQAPPYFKVELTNPDKGKSLDLGPTNRHMRLGGGVILNDTPETSNSVVRNEILFRFGIVLLELGYSKPWARLKRPVLSILPPNKQTDYHAAVKLTWASFLTDRMGPRYPIIVRKCLSCDFGLGEDSLEDEELQGTFLVDVVNALQEVETGLRSLGLEQLTE